MIRRLVIVTTLTAAVPSLQVPVAAQEPAMPVFGVELDIVRLDVVVLDDDGTPVTGLVAGDFEIVEDGEPRDVVSFEPVVVRSRPGAGDDASRISANRLRSPAEGRSIVVLFDDIHVTPVVSEYVRDALVRFIEEDLRDGDWLTVLSPGQGLRWTGRTTWEHQQMVPFVRRLQGQLVRDPTATGISDWEAVRTNEYGFSRPGLGCGGGEGRTVSFLSEEVTAAAKRRLEATLAALRQALEALIPLPGQKSLVLVSEGFVLLPNMTGYRELVDLARRANVAIHSLDPRTLEGGFAAESAGPAGPTGTLRMLESAGTDEVAGATGGRSLVSNDPLRGLRQVAREAEAYYLIGFQPERAEAGLREVEVRVTRPGLSVRSRTRYVAGPGAAVPEVSEKDRWRASLRSIAETSDLPLRIATLFFEDNGKGKVTTMYATEIRFPRGTEGRRKVKTIAEAHPRDGGQAAPRRVRRDAGRSSLACRPSSRATGTCPPGCGRSGSWWRTRRPGGWGPRCTPSMCPRPTPSVSRHPY